ncbi:uncharacterized protein BYT42DRAFT_565351 [Radiomyces spectabilis]|uniref:uncharacterized protein n=1 Tax=Radiomyces spectabilis TaxID=64574 RepID=UPI00221E6228|nr:uncharacterized protein BYT42DRAFT_565351 [Radiomyces spectabilis]KAI8381126.1 hypothetical protein BYT42DRAFT_565351 [Radiomyces spectabilis]
MSIHVGFYNVPVTKFLLLFVGGCSILSAILNLKPAFHLQLSPHITVHHQFWRLLTSHCAFANSGDVFFGSLLLYVMRVIERLYGSSKYAAFVFLAVVLSTLLEIGALVSLARLGLRSFPGGPFALIFVMVYQYHRVIPVTYRFRVFGVTFNDKCFVYFLALQMLISQGFSTIIPCVCGLMAGALWRSDIGNIKRWRFSCRIREFSARYIQPMLATAPTARSSAPLPRQGQVIGLAVDNGLLSGGVLRNRRSTTNDTNLPTTGLPMNGASVREYIDTFTGRAPMAAADVTAPAEEDIMMLSMMFPEHPREAIIRALSSANNDLQRAAEIMLNTPAPSGSNSA